MSACAFLCGGGGGGAPGARVCQGKRAAKNSWPWMTLARADRAREGSGAPPTRRKRMHTTRVAKIRRPMGGRGPFWRAEGRGIRAGVSAFLSLDAEKVAADIPRESRRVQALVPRPRGLPHVPKREGELVFARARPRARLRPRVRARLPYLVGVDGGSQRRRAAACWGPGAPESRAWEPLQGRGRASMTRGRCQRGPTWFRWPAQALGTPYSALTRVTMSTSSRRSRSIVLLLGVSPATAHLVRGPGPADFHRRY